MESGNELRMSIESGFRIGLRFCPLEYLKLVSRELHRRMDISQLDCSVLLQSLIQSIPLVFLIIAITLSYHLLLMQSTRATDEFISQVKYPWYTLTSLYLVNVMDMVLAQLFCIHRYVIHFYPCCWHDG